MLMASVKTGLVLLMTATIVLAAIAVAWMFVKAGAETRRSHPPRR